MGAFIVSSLPPFVLLSSSSRALSASALQIKLPPSSINGAFVDVSPAMVVPADPDLDPDVVDVPALLEASCDATGGHTAAPSRSAFDV